MSLHAFRSASNRVLWESCVDRFLAELRDHTGPSGYPTFIWLTHRLQRDALFREAARRGLRGWLAPPIAFFSQLPTLFDIRMQPVSLFRRRALIGRLATIRGQEFGIGSVGDLATAGVTHAMDHLFGELLPEGVRIDHLRSALEELGGDAFAQRRNRWISTVYGDYLSALMREDRYDPRAIHALVAAHIARGALRRALNGAQRLHVYGMASLRSRHRLIQALRDQAAVEVFLYLPLEEESTEWDDLLGSGTTLDAGEHGAPVVQPVPDARREFEWIALQIKKLIIEQNVEPHEIAVVARTGREDTADAHDILGAAGIPTTARIRSAFSEVPALKAILQLFRGAATGWRYRPLRHVLESAYFDTDVDLRAVDYIAKERRVEGLENWQRELQRLSAAVGEDEDDRRSLARAGVFEDRLARDVSAFDEFVERVAPLSAPRSLRDWIELARELLDPGWFGFRKRLCRDDGGRWEVVRLDQQAVSTLLVMLGEWVRDADGEVAITPADWYVQFKRFLATNEIGLSTPLKTGVQLLEAHEAALFPFQHTFIVHANDGEFPRAPGSGFFFGDEELTALAGRGLPLADRVTSLRRERTLWRAVASNPRVNITYRTADPNGVPLLPSLMVPDHDPATEIPRTREAWPEPFSSVHVRRSTAWMLAKLRREGRDGSFLGPEAAPLRHAIVQSHAESQRRAGRRGSDREAGTLGPWNGELRDPWLLRYLGERFGEDRVWSASQLEGYAQCPFIYLVERILWLQEFGEAEEQTSPLTFGGVAHEILERFYRKYQGPYPTEFTGPPHQVFNDVVLEVITEKERCGEWLGVSPLWNTTRRDIAQRVLEYLEWELPKLRHQTPELCEYAFGVDDDDAAWIDGVDLSGQRVRIALRGKVDRIDLLSSGARHIIDYKSGYTPTTGWYDDGSALQMPLYMQAVADRLKGDVAGGEYRSIKDQKTGGKVRWGDQRFETALRIALTVPSRIRAGYFEAKAAKARKWAFWWPGLAVCRVDAVFNDGSRFDD